MREPFVPSKIVRITVGPWNSLSRLTDSRECGHRSLEGEVGEPGCSREKADARGIVLVQMLLMLAPGLPHWGRVTAERGQPRVLRPKYAQSHVFRRQGMGS